MKNIIAATALALMTTTTAFGAAHNASFSEYTVTQNDLRASNFIGMRIYATESEIGENHMMEANGEKEWDDIGEINDVILSRDGSVKAVILGVGGFLGIGEKDVAVQMDQIKVVREKDDANDFFLVVNSNKAMLEAAPAVQHEEAMHNKIDDTKTASNDTTMTDDDRTMLRTPVPPIREGYSEASYEELTAERLTGARVYDINDEDIGEIDKLILTDDGKISRAVVDVGGFLGLGEHSVSVTFDELKVTRDAEWSDIRVYIDATQEELEAQPQYKG